MINKVTVAGKIKDKDTRKQACPNRDPQMGLAPSLIAPKLSKVSTGVARFTKYGKRFPSRQG